MWKQLQFLLVLKVLLFSGLIGLFYRTIRPGSSLDVAVAQTRTETQKRSEKDEPEGSRHVPDVPTGNITLSEAVALREKLEFLKKDVEEKIRRLALAKKSYDESKRDVEFKLKRIEEERRLLDETLQKEKKSKEERLSETLEFVAKMEPRKAGPVVETLDRDLVLHLFRKLPPKQVTKILEAVTPKKAAELMEYYTRIRSGREYELMKQIGSCGPDKDDNEDSKNSPRPDVKGNGFLPSIPKGESGVPSHKVAEGSSPAGTIPTPGLPVAGIVPTPVPAPGAIAGIVPTPVPAPGAIAGIVPTPVPTPGAIAGIVPTSVPTPGPVSAGLSSPAPNDGKAVQSPGTVSR